MATLEKKSRRKVGTPTAKRVGAKTVEKTASKAAPKAAKKAPQGSYAVFMTGGKQYRVQAGESLKIEKILGVFKEGDTIAFDKVLLITDGKEDTKIGSPYITGASVSATLKKIGRYKTVDVIKYKQKSRYFKKNGHRQPYFEVTIDSIK